MTYNTTGGGRMHARSMRATGLVFTTQTYRCLPSKHEGRPEYPKRFGRVLIHCVWKHEHEGFQSLCCDKPLTRSSGIVSRNPRQPKPIKKLSLFSGQKRTLMSPSGLGFDVVVANPPYLTRAQATSNLRIWGFQEKGGHPFWVPSRFYSIWARKGVIPIWGNVP